MCTTLYISGINLLNPGLARGNPKKKLWRTYQPTRVIQLKITLIMSMWKEVNCRVDPNRIKKYFSLRIEKNFFMISKNFTYVVMYKTVPNFNILVDYLDLNKLPPIYFDSYSDKRRKINQPMHCRRKCTLFSRNLHLPLWSHTQVWRKRIYIFICICVNNPCLGNAVEVYVHGR